MFFVFLEVITDLSSWWYDNVFVDDGLPDAAVPAYVYVLHENRFVDFAETVDAHIRRQH